MMAKAPQTSVFSGDQLSKLLGLLKAADSVELKLTVPETDHRSAMTALHSTRQESSSGPAGSRERATTRS